ncbi:MAG: hypothetical protein FJW90_04535 [Actinobacteria bacterium]|nr:hypothetical protein [Actinomycetota bacterium]
MALPRRHGRSAGAACALACVLAGLVLTSCGDDGPEPEGEAPLDLVIGSSVPLSGELSAYGPAGREAAALAAERIRLAARRSGAPHRVTVLTRDNATSPATAVTTARELVERGGASCLVGAWASTDTLAIAESVSVPDKVLQISPASTAGEITALDDDGLLMRTAPPDALEGLALEQAVSDALGGAEGRVANIGARDDNYGDDLAAAFSDPWVEAGGSVGEDVSYELETDPDGPVLPEAAERITDGDPDAVVIADYPETFAELAPELSATGSWRPARAWATAALASPVLSEQLGEAAIEGMRGVTPATPRDGEASRAFGRLYRRSARGGVPRGRFDAHQFDATILCYLAAVSAGSTEGEKMADALIDLTSPEGAEYDWRRLPEAIAALQRGEDIDYTGASGPIDMDENGDPTAASFDVYRHTRGGVELIGQVAVEPDRG